MNEYVWLVMLAVFVAGLSFVAFSLVNLRRSRVDPRLYPEETDIGTLPSSGTGSATRLDRGSRPDFVLTKDSEPEFVLGELTPALAKQIPTSREDLEKLQPELVAAGFYSPHALTQYLAIRATLVIVPLIVAGCLAVLLDRSRLLYVGIGGLVVALLGYSLPRIYVNYLARDRRRQIESGLPVAVDLLTLGISAGQNILIAFQRVAKELKFSYPVLANELELVHRQAALNTLVHALEQFAERVQVPEIHNLVMILTQSERLGTDVASGLLEFAANFRTTLRQRVDAKANRASFWMLFPTVLCLMIPAMIVLGAPIIYEMNARHTNSVRIRESKPMPENVKKADRSKANGS